MKKQVRECESIPRFYGLAYREYDRRVGVCYPIPFNIVVRIAMNIWWSLKSGFFPDWYEEKLFKVDREAWQRGYDFGVKTAKSLTNIVAEDLLERILETQNEPK